MGKKDTGEITKENEKNEDIKRGGGGSLSVEKSDDVIETFE